MTGRLDLGGQNVRSSTISRRRLPLLSASDRRPSARSSTNRQLPFVRPVREQRLSTGRHSSAVIPRPRYVDRLRLVGPATQALSPERSRCWAGSTSRSLPIPAGYPAARRRLLARHSLRRSHPAACWLMPLSYSPIASFACTSLEPFKARRFGSNCCGCCPTKSYDSSSVGQLAPPSARDSGQLTGFENVGDAKLILGKHGEFEVFCRICRYSPMEGLHGPMDGEGPKVRKGTEARTWRNAGQWPAWCI